MTRADELALMDVPARPESVADARAAVRAAAGAAGLAAGRIDDLVIAVSEACTNALEAQLAADVDTPIEVSCRLRGDQLEVAVRDHGTGFLPDHLRARPPLQYAEHLDVERGWGIQLMRQLVDEVLFDVTGEGMLVCLRMRVGSDLGAC